MDFSNYKFNAREALFSQMKPEDEKLCPVPWDADYEWTETSMFGFNIPEHDIDAIIYFWFHPVLRVTYGGIMIWRGKNTNQIACDYSDYRLCMPMPADITNCTYANGVSVRMIEPMQEFAISFEDPKYDTKLDLNLKAIMPPAVRYNGGHFTQAMKTSGTLTLLGEDFIIDGYHSRDRSWDESRREAMRHTPPLNWTVGIMGDDFAFHHVSFDNRKYHPEWADMFPAHRDDGNVLWGYIWDGKDVYGVTAVDQKTTYSDEDGVFPVRAETILTGSNGKTYPIVGTARASTQIQCWPNMSGFFVLMEWSYEGRKGYGDIQQITFRDAYRKMYRKG